jgi:glycine C-acetyltransferase
MHAPTPSHKSDPSSLSAGTSTPSGDGTGENIDLCRVLLSGRRKSLADRAIIWAEHAAGAVADRRGLYGREVCSAADRIVDVWDEATGSVQQMLMFGSNNYLGLATHPHVLKSVRSAMAAWGVGLGGPPLLNGTTRLHSALEERLAALKGKESAALFSSGYGTNLGLIAGLVQSTDRVLYDAESHASLCDGLKLGGITGQRFRHNDVAHLATLLEQEPASGQQDVFVGVEGVYSMQGDLAPLDQIAPLCRQHGALLMVDDAHGTGVVGPYGRGTAAYFKVDEDVDLVVGTFSKTFSVTGGFVAAAAPIIEYLRFFARPYVFSAALPPVVVAAVHAGLDVLEREPERVERLRNNVRYVARGLRALGLSAEPEAAIIALRAPVDMDFQSAAQHFHRLGLFVNATEFPAVPRDQQLFRISLMATHEQADLDRLLDGIEAVWHRFDPS